MPAEMVNYGLFFTFTTNSATFATKLLTALDGTWYHGGREEGDPLLPMLSEKLSCFFVRAKIIVVHVYRIPGHDSPGFAGAVQSCFGSVCIIVGASCLVVVACRG
jgi:hypothetical protein